MIIVAFTVCILVFLFQSESLLAQNTVVINGSTFNNSDFFNVNLCESEYSAVLSDLTETLEAWREMEFRKFCKKQCAENICQIYRHETTTEGTPGSYGYNGRKRSVQERLVQQSKKSEFELKSINLMKRQNIVNIKDSQLHNSNFYNINICQNEDLAGSAQSFSNELTEILQEKLLPAFCKREKERGTCSCV